MPHDPIREIETWREVRSPLPLTKRGKWRRYARRDLASVDTVVVHQTAVSGGFGVGSRLLAAHGGDVLSARQSRLSGTPYVGVYLPQDRASIVQWPAWAYMNHANKGNHNSVGWAYDGKFPGDDLDVEGARASLAHLVECVRDQGADLKFIEAHRQHSAARGGDPGQEIWRDVVLRVAWDLDLEVTDRTTGSGKPIPEDWIYSEVC